MSVLKVRRRLLNVRLSEDEYEALVRLAIAKGAHSTSDLARTALMEYLERENGGQPVHERIAQLEGEIRRLGRAIDALASVARQSA